MVLCRSPSHLQICQLLQMWKLAPQLRCMGSLNPELLGSLFGLLCPDHQVLALPFCSSKLLLCLQPSAQSACNV